MNGPLFWTSEAYLIKLPRIQLSFEILKFILFRNTPGYCKLVCLSRTHYKYKTSVLIYQFYKNVKLKIILPILFSFKRKRETSFLNLYRLSSKERLVTKLLGVCEFAVFRYRNNNTEKSTSDGVLGESIRVNVVEPRFHTYQETSYFQSAGFPNEFSANIP